MAGVVLVSMGVVGLAVSAVAIARARRELALRRRLDVVEVSLVPKRPCRARTSGIVRAASVPGRAR